MKKSLHPDDEALLVEALVNRSHKAYNELYDRYSNALTGIIFRMVHDQTIAEDLLQETFVKVWKSIHRHDPAKGRLFTWLCKVARNTALDYLRTAHLDEHLEPHVEWSDIAGINVDQIGLRETVLAVLDGQQQQIIDLIYFQGFTQQETADHLSLPIGTVKTRARMALVVLRNRFSSEA